MIARSPVALEAVLVLAACGGGGGSITDGTSRPAFDDIASAVTKVIKAEQNLAGVIDRHQFALGSGWSLQDIEGDLQSQYRSLPSRYGVSRAVAEGSEQLFPNETLSFRRYAGWLEHHAFFVEEVTLQESKVTHAPERFVHSAGIASGASPGIELQSATWRGHAVGYRVGGFSGTTPIEGDATITLSFDIVTEAIPDHLDDLDGMTSCVGSFMAGITSKRAVSSQHLPLWARLAQHASNTNGPPVPLTTARRFRSAPSAGSPERVARRGSQWAGPSPSATRCPASRGAGSLVAVMAASPRNRAPVQVVSSAWGRLFEDSSKESSR